MERIRIQKQKKRIQTWLRIVKSFNLTKKTSSRPDTGTGIGSCLKVGETWEIFGDFVECKHDRVYAKIPLSGHEKNLIVTQQQLPLLVTVLPRLLVLLGHHVPGLAENAGWRWPSC